MILFVLSGNYYNALKMPVDGIVSWIPQSVKHFAQLLRPGPKLKEWAAANPDNSFTFYEEIHSPIGMLDKVLAD